MAREPLLRFFLRVFRLSSDDLDAGDLCDQVATTLVHEGQELLAAPALRVLAHRDLPVTSLERGEKGRGAAPLEVVVAVSRQRASVSAASDSPARGSSAWIDGCSSTQCGDGIDRAAPCRGRPTSASLAGGRSQGRSRGSRARRGPNAEERRVAEGGKKPTKTEPDCTAHASRPRAY